MYSILLAARTTCVYVVRVVRHRQAGSKGKNIPTLQRTNERTNERGNERGNKKKKGQAIQQGPPLPSQHQSIRNNAASAQPHAINARPPIRLAVAEVEVPRFVPAHDARVPDAQRRQAERREQRVCGDRAIIDMADSLLQVCAHGTEVGAETVLVELQGTRRDPG